MEILKNSALINLYSKPTPYDLGNKILYQLCSSHPKHDKDEEIIAKVWLIGRAYSVALERNKKKDRETNDTFYIKDVVAVFRNSDLDDKIAELKSVDELNSDNIKKSLEIHAFLVKCISSITEQSNRSFCSKYLHFHFPNLFYIYDSNALSALRKLKIPTKEFLITDEDIDKEYSQFSYRCLHLQKTIFENTGIRLSIRQLDNLLLEISKNNKF